MTDSLTSEALLLEIAERQKVIQKELAGLASAQTAALEKYENSDNLYKEQLKRYDKELSEEATGRYLAIFLRIMAVLLLAYIAYRIAP